MSLFNYFTRIQFGLGAINTLKAECDNHKIARPLLVTDKGIVAAGMVAEILTLLSPFDVSVFDGTPNNPTEHAVREGAAQFLQSGCDGIIALGGGSSLDCAKCIGIAATHPGGLKLYATMEGGSDKILNSVPPIVAIPTTSGSGSEVARGALVILDDDRKLGLHSMHIVPSTAICDPRLTLSLPPNLTAATGMDAFTHCVEAYLSAAINPTADAIALDGVARAWRSIHRATLQGNDIEARTEMMIAGLHGGLAFQKGLGAVHSLSHGLGAVHHGIHHGTLNAILLPFVLRYNSSAESVMRDRRVEQLAYAMRLPAGADISDAIAQSNLSLGLPGTLAEMGVTEDAFQRVAELATNDHCHKTNPRCSTSEDYVRLLSEAMSPYCPA